MRINGNTYTAEVTSADRLKTEAVAHSPAASAVHRQDSYAVPFEQDSSAVTSDFFYLKNTDDRNLYMYRVKLFTPTLDLEIDVKTGVTGTPTGGTTITPVNLYTGGKAADVTCEGKDGDMALTGGNVVTKLFLDKDFVGEQVWDFPAPICLPSNTAMVLHVNIDPTADVDGTIYFYFGDE